MAGKAVDRDGVKTLWMRFLASMAKHTGDMKSNIDSVSRGLTEVNGGTYTIDIHIGETVPNGSYVYIASGDDAHWSTDTYYSTFSGAGFDNGELLGTSSYDSDGKPLSYISGGVVLTEILVEDYNTGEFYTQTEYDKDWYVTFTVLNENKVDAIINNETQIVATQDYGGFKAGNAQLLMYGGAAIGNNSISSAGGGAIGDSAQTGTGGSVGKDSQSSTGGAVGKNAYATFGGAIGESASSLDGGFAGGSRAYTSTGGAVGYSASASSGGAAVGSGAEATSGGAVGYGACAGPGFSGGATATVTRDENGDPIDAIQLGTGTNTNEKTLQVYDYQLMDANGNIPAERLTNAKGKIYTCEIASGDFTEGTSAEGVTYYYCTKTVTGITASDVPIVDASLSSDIDAAKLQLEAYQCVDKIETATDAITVYCFGDLPEVTFSINLMVC